MKTAQNRRFRASPMLTAAAAGLALASAAPAPADVVDTTNCGLWHTLEVWNKAPNTTVHIIQLVGGVWVEIGPDITTDVLGRGWGWDWNGSGLGAWHPDRPTCTGHKVGSVWVPDANQMTPYYTASNGVQGFQTASLRPGTNAPEIRVGNAGSDRSGHSCVASWSGGTTLALTLDPSQAQFVNQGATISAPGMSVSILSVTSSAINFRVNSNASSPQTPQVISITGVAVNAVGAVGSKVDLSLTATAGTSAFYLNGVLTGTKAFSVSTAPWGIQSIPITAATAPSVTELGVISTANSGALVDTTIMPREVKWYHFTVNPSVTDTGGFYLDLDSIGSSASNGTDTMIGLYDQVGNLIASDDDDGPGYTSQLSFGQRTPTRPPSGDGMAGNGRDGDLPAGGYFLGVSLYESVYGPTGWAAGSSAWGTGTVRVNFTTNLAPPVLCYANCDGSTTPPAVNTSDFTCYLQKYAAASVLPAAQQQADYANCDGSTTFPQVNTMDFTCYLQKYAAGCSA